MATLLIQIEADLVFGILVISKYMYICRQMYFIPEKPFVMKPPKLLNYKLAEYEYNLYNQSIYCLANIFFSYLVKSQQDLQLLLEEGELEEQLKNMLEADLETINTTAAAIAEHKKRERRDFDMESKDTSHSGSIPGSEPLSRKEFIFDGLKYSPASSMQGSKASLSSSLHKGSKASLSSTTPPKGSKASLVSETRLKGSKGSIAAETPPKGSKASLVAETHAKETKTSVVSETPPKSEITVIPILEMPQKESKPSPASETHSKGSKESLLSETPPKGTSVNIESETPSSLPSDPSPQKEEGDSKEASAVDVKVSTARSTV